MPDSETLKPVIGPNVWTAEEIAKREDWIFLIDDMAVAEISTALTVAKQTNIPFEDIGKEHFPLANLGNTLLEMGKQLSEGLGFCLLKGLPVDQFDESDLELVYWGLGAHLGVGVSQSFRGDRLGHVMDMSHTGDTRRSYRSPRPLRLHVDPVDVVGLLCHRIAKSGGTSLICSSMAVHNAILESRPDYLPTLYEGYHYHSTEDPKSGDPIATHYRIQVFDDVDGRKPGVFTGPPIDLWVEENPDSFSDTERDALAFFHETTPRDDLVFRMDREIGDIQFLNNRLILHGRTEFEDFPELDRKRHMLRLWLMVPEWTSLPPNMKHRTKHDRFGGGVPVTT